MNARPVTRLFVENPLEHDQPVRLDEGRAHFLRNVLRLEPGAFVTAFNPNDGEWLARIEAVGKTSASITPVERRRPPVAASDSQADLWLLFAPLKRGRIDLVAEKATELGVSVLQPVFTKHTDPQRVNTERLRANAIEAAEQCERLSVPDVREPADLTDLLTNWPPQRSLIVCAETGETRPIGEVALELANQPAAFLVGPEGGFADSELALLRSHPAAIAVGLGPRILRAETAAMAALAAWQALAGDWTRSGLDNRPQRNH